MQEKQFLSPADIAGELSVSTATVLRLIHAGQLPAIRVSERIYRIPRASFEMFSAGTLPHPGGLAPIKDVPGPAPALGAGEILPRRKLAASSRR
jgi:excisionase family DNA binding protein